MPPFKRKSTDIFPSDDECYLGIDPGESGALSILSGRVLGVEMLPISTSHHQISDWLRERKPKIKMAVIEQIIPRPTMVFDKRVMGKNKMVPRILKSTCLIYGSYRMLRAMLVALEIPFREVDPKAWQGKLGMKRKKGEADREWKNRLKAKAEELFPQIRVTLATADSLLIANHCRTHLKG